MDALPTEIRLAIASHLTTSGPSPYTSTIPQIPTCSDTRHDKYHGSVKSLSSTCKAWRCLLFETLFSRAVIHIRPADYHVGETGNNSSDATRFRQAMKAIGADISKGPLARLGALAQVRSLTVKVCDSFTTTKALRNPAQHSTDIITICEFWRRVFEAVDPLRLALIAPVCILGFLTTVVPEMGDAWAFPDMTLQMLELSQDVHQHVHTLALGSKAHDAWDTEYLFNIRPWTRLRLVEGSMLQAYGIYEYFHKTPPSIVRGLIFPRSDRLNSFSDHVLFPFNNHIDQMQLVSLSYYNHIHFHFSASPNDHVLDDPRVVGKAELSDCWRELEQIYQRTVSFDPPSPLFRPGSSVTEFSTGDYAIGSIRDLLDRAFAEHAVDGWEAVEPGKWIRRADAVTQVAEDNATSSEPVDTTRRHLFFPM